MPTCACLRTIQTKTRTCISPVRIFTNTRNTRSNCEPPVKFCTGTTAYSASTEYVTYVSPSARFEDQCMRESTLIMYRAGGDTLLCCDWSRAHMHEICGGCCAYYLCTRRVPGRITSHSSCTLACKLHSPTSACNTYRDSETKTIVTGQKSKIPRELQLHQVALRCVKDGGDLNSRHDVPYPYARTCILRRHFVPIFVLCQNV